MHSAALGNEYESAFRGGIYVGLRVYFNLTFHDIKRFKKVGM
jgi:hypothetical protein